MRARGNARWERILRGEPRGVWDRLAGAGLWTLSVGYGAALRLHLLGYRLGIARRTRLAARVISIGNLTLGGTGKTTASLAVARWLADQGQAVAVLSRGYGGSGEGKSVVVSEGFGPLVEWTQAGDEAFLMARMLPGVFVLAGKDRRRTGRRAVQEFGAEALVLDDGFQYQRLQKDVEIVLVDALEPFGHDFFVPRGLLREPVRHLASADAVWITHCDLARDADVAKLRKHVSGLAPRARIWETVHAPVRLRELSGADEWEPDAIRGRRVCALSSVGNPVSFERTLEKLGAIIVARSRFPDHHVYRAEQLWDLARDEATSAEWIVTTEKDAVRLTPGEVGKPVCVLGVELARWEGASTLSEELSCLLTADPTGS
jgi:tetraacyldisaccharide 4'-kinase